GERGDPDERQIGARRLRHGFLLDSSTDFGGVGSSGRRRRCGGWKRTPAGRSRAPRRGPPPDRPKLSWHAGRGAAPGSRAGGRVAIVLDGCDAGHPESRTRVTPNWVWE